MRLSTPSYHKPHLVGGLALATSAPALACASCQWGSFGPNAGSFVQLFLVWILGVLITTHMAHRLKVDAGQIPEGSASPAWGHAIFLIALMFLGGAFLGPLALGLAILIAGVSSISSLRAPKPMPIIVLLLHGCLIAGLMYLGEVNSKQIEQAGGQEIWTLMHQRPNSRNVMGLVHRKSSEQIEELLIRARASDEVPEEMIAWLEAQAEHARSREESEKVKAEDKRRKAELRKQEREAQAVPESD